ncbi:glycerophosphoryl diester phosphodiesterase membrane domain-containing protein [Salinibacterium sp. ZJ450]|uniref:glycerophosphoryl diester phosphodiesterase membrane domain-containing protein n=1 Tax=Salinibacterium sp. ZJ450 TaxID=2708338 RepID=UPI001422CCAF|nr:glycerophosphoryl diester phosphodiesterase membrane domain-containing protein [Salinibacterium sp. ZJ450]
MSDDQTWQPPAGNAVPPPPAAPQFVPPQYGQPAQAPSPYGQPAPAPSPYGQPAPLPYGQPAPRPYGQYAAPAGAPFGAPALTGAPGWTPPPKPGLIPLRPLSLGTILGASFQVLRRNPKPTFGMSLLMQGIVMAVTLVVLSVVTAIAISRADMATGQDVDTVTAGATAAILLSAIIPFVLSLIAAGMMQGIIVLEVGRATLGEKLRFRGLWRLAKGRIGALVGWILLLTLVVVIAMAIVALLVFFVGQLGDAGFAGAVAISLIGTLGLVVLGAWLSTKLAMVPSALMIERLSLRDAMARSWSLTNGYFWRTLGILLLVNVILSVAGQIVSAPLSIVFSLAIPLLTIGGDPTTAIIAAVVTYVLLIAVTLVITAITLVVSAATTGLLYLDLRIRKEGLDLELTRFVEARQAGDDRVPDPLLPASRPDVGSQAARSAAAAQSPWA